MNMRRLVQIVSLTVALAGTLLIHGCSALQMDRAATLLEHAGAKALADCRQEALTVGEACHAAGQMYCGAKAVVQFDQCFAEVRARAELLRAQAEALETASQ